MRKKHSWVKVRIHVYVCRECGTGRVNAQTRRGEWFTTFHLPDGRSIIDYRVPPCEVGPRTAAVQRKYGALFACPESWLATAK